jgi:hypothetical protein
MKKATPTKEECIPSHGNHCTSASRTEAATSKAFMAVTQNSRIGTINELDTTAEQLERAPISTVAPV